MSFLSARTTTQCLILRCVRMDDAAALCPLMTPDISRWTATWPSPLPLETAETLLSNWLDEAANGTTFPAIIEAKGSDAIMGWMKISFTADEADLSYWIAPHAQRQGYAREAAFGAIRFAFERPGIMAVTAGAQVGNEASHRLLVQLGMSRDGTRDVFAPARNQIEPCAFWRLERDG